MDKARLKLGAVPVRVAAKVYGRDPAWVRAGIIAGWLPIGEATRNGRRVTDLKEMSSKYGRIANANIKAKIQELGLDPQNTEDKKEIKKISSVEMQRARDKVGASGQKSKVRFSDREWEAIQAGAISDNMLSKFLNSSDSDEIVKRAMPKTTASLSSAKLTKARAMLRSGYTYKEIAQACGVPESTVYDALGK